MALVWLNIRSKKEPWVEEGIQKYLKKITPFSRIDLKEIKSKSLVRAASAEKIQKESQELLSAIDESDFVILWDEAGKSFNNSEQLAEQLTEVLTQRSKNVVFVTGGAFGASKELKSRADLILSFSPYTLNHMVFQLAALEQVYRCYCIINNIPYHNR